METINEHKGNDQVEGHCKRTKYTLQFVKATVYHSSHRS